MYLGNILTSQLDSEHIEALLNSFVDTQNRKNDHYNVESFDVFKDCIYVKYRHEVVVKEAVEFFDNYVFRGNQIQAKLLHEPDMFVKRSYLCDEVENNDDYEKCTEFSHIDCEIIVNTRQFK